MGFLIALGVLVGIVLLFFGFEMAVRITKKRNERFDFEEFKLSKTTGRNSDGTKRQDILERMAGKDKEFRKVNYEIRQYKHGEDEIYGVLVNGYRVGDIDEEDVQRLLSVWNRVDEIFYVKPFSIRGGRSYGATLKLKLKKPSAQSGD